MIKVSVVVPIYNAEKYLEQCLSSIVNQTLKEIEIILINDGSRDGSEDICKKYLSDARVTYYYKENEGLAAARQDGMDKATGEYIGFVDSDDWLEPDMYEKMYKAAKSNDSDVVFCNWIKNNESHRFSPEIECGPYDREKIKSCILPKSLSYIDDNGNRRVIRWSNCLRIYKIETLKHNNIKFDCRFRRSQDSLFTYEAMLVAQNFYYLGDGYLYHNRVVEDSLSRGYTKNMWSLYVPLIERLYKDTEEFEEIDLMPQMHLRNFFFVMECIENEFKPLCPNNREEKIKNVSEIVNDPICEKFYGQLPLKECSPIYKKYYKLILKKDAEKIVDCMVDYINKTEEKRLAKKHIRRRIMNFLTESKVLGSVYKKIRGKN